MTRHYDLPFDRQSISREDLRVADPDLQIDIMREWFFQHYRNPVHECPYNGREGGFLYINGGPYDAEDELVNEFIETVGDDEISKLVEELEAECSEWSGVSKPEDYDDYLLAFIGTSENAYASLEASVQNLRDLLSVNHNPRLETTLFQMLYVNSITALEAFLSEFFIGKINSDSASLRAFVESNPDFKNEKFPLSEIFKKNESLNNHVKEYLIKLLWHNLSKLKPMFKASLAIEFPESIEFLMKAVNVRHDLVHRNGKTKDGEIIDISKDDLTQLFDEIILFAKHIDTFNPVENQPFGF